MTVCVFRTDPRPIPVPDSVKTIADGVRVFVETPDAYAIDAIGDAARLASQIKDIPPAR